MADDIKVLGAGEITLVSDLKATDRLRYNTEITCLTSGNHAFWASKGEENKFYAIKQGLSIDMGKPLLYINSTVENNDQVNDAWVMYPKAEFPKHINDLDLSGMTSSEISSILGNKKLYITGTISNGLFTVLEIDNTEIPEYYWFPVQSEDSSYPYGVGFPEYGTERDIKSYIINSDSELPEGLPRWIHFQEDDNSTYPIPEINENIYLCAIYDSDNASSYNYFSDDSSLDKIHSGIWTLNPNYNNSSVNTRTYIFDADHNAKYQYVSPDTEYYSNVIDWEFSNTKRNYYDPEPPLYFIDYLNQFQTPVYDALHYDTENKRIIHRSGFEGCYYIKIKNPELPFYQIESQKIISETHLVQNSVWTIKPDNETYQYLLIGTINPDGQYVALDKDNYYFKLSYEQNDDYTTQIDRYSINLIELMSYTYDEMGNNFITLSNEQEEMTQTIQQNMITVTNMINTAEGMISDLNSAMNSEVTSLNFQIESLRMDLTSSLEINISNLNSLSNTINTYFKFNSDGLTIGKSDSPIFLKLENDRITFINNSGVEMAWFSNDTLTVADIKGNNSLGLGGFSFYEDANNNVHLNWIGKEGE